jgi:hypothetical protein
MLPDLVAKELQLRPRRWVYRFDDRGPFAYVQGRDLIRTTDHTVWAQLSDGALRSARSGRRIAYEVADVFYDAQTHAPVFYQSPELALPGAPVREDTCGADDARRASAPHREVPVSEEVMSELGPMS